ncbi:hypothetical protein KIW84_044085 [Lathyrus oleraceus]|uniref:Uncharacterized protein n=1 Tax=Pisum sativum TaxID=3888 RepID=A0A9D4XFC5_PEA|nr:hypothetical protein KIW84_044085 [Pisum sativum]
MNSDRNALVTVRDGVQGRDEWYLDSAVPAPTVAQNDVVNDGTPVRQSALPHRLRDYERFHDNKVNNDGDFVHFTLMAESEPVLSYPNCISKVAATKPGLNFFEIFEKHRLEAFLGLSHKFNVHHVRAFYYCVVPIEDGFGFSSASLPSGASSSVDHGSAVITRADLDRWGERMFLDQRALSAQHNAKLDHILAQLVAHNVGQTNAYEDPKYFEMKDY